MLKIQETKPAFVNNQCVVFIIQLNWSELKRSIMIGSMSGTNFPIRNAKINRLRYWQRTFEVNKVFQFFTKTKQKCFMPSPPALRNKPLSAAFLSSVYWATIKQHKNWTNMAMDKRSIAAFIETFKPA